MKKLLAAAILSTASLSAMAAGQGAYLSIDAGPLSMSNAGSPAHSI